MLEVLNLRRVRLIVPETLSGSRPPTLVAGLLLLMYADSDGTRPLGVTAAAPTTEVFSEDVPSPGEPHPNARANSETMPNIRTNLWIMSQASLFLGGQANRTDTTVT